jgi:rhamnosyltransferase
MSRQLKSKSDLSLFRVGAVVVLFHPDKDLKNRLESYCHGMQRVYALDNSPLPLATYEIASLPVGVEYRWNQGNLGLAAALNLGIQYLKSDGCSWVLTMDQDSRFVENGIQGLLKIAEGSSIHTALVVPRIILSEEKLHTQDLRSAPKKNKGGGIESITVAMTSGSLYRMDAIEKAGGFDESLFLDYVDYDMCLKIRRLGLKGIRANSVELLHRLGALQTQTILKWQFRPTHHNPIRRYYITRNRLELMWRYPSFATIELWAFCKDVVKVTLFENQRGKKWMMMFKGAFDFARRRFGKLNGV